MNNTRAYRVYLALEGATAFLFALIFTVSAIYRIQVVGLDPLQLVLVGTLLELTCFIFEVPTGVVADTFSRRLSIIIGIFLLGLGFGMEGIVPTFGVVLLGQVVSGLGYTFTSGATEAWIADEVGEEHLPQLFIRASQLGQAGGILGVVGGIALGSLQIGLPIVIGSALVLVLGVVLIFVMPETGFKPAPRGDRTTWQAMTGTFREGAGMVRRQPRLITFMLLAAFLGMASEGWDRLAEAHFLLNVGFPDVAGLQPVFWLGSVGIVGGLLSMGAQEIARRRLDLERRDVVVRSVTLFTALRIVCILLFAVASNFYLAVFARWGKAIFHSLQDPIYRAWLNQSIEPQVRATVLSMTGQADAIGQIAGGPGIGAVGKLVSVQAAIALSGLLLAPALPLFARAHRQGDEPEGEEARVEAPVASEA